MYNIVHTSCDRRERAFRFPNQEVSIGRSTDHGRHYKWRWTMFCRAAIALLRVNVIGLWRL